MDKHTKQLINRLRQVITNPVSELKFNSNYELLVAVILSAQCTDKRVNEVTQVLFKVANTPTKIDAMTPAELENYIHACGFYHNKAKNIKLMTRQLIEKFDGVVPDNYEDLVSLAGVGSKTANVVLAVGFGKPGLAVDTHVHRVSIRLGLSNSPNPLINEKDLKNIFDKKDWAEVHHLLLLFGRYYCTSRNPKCDNCVCKDMCKYIKSR